MEEVLYTTTYTSIRENIADPNLIFPILQDRKRPKDKTTIYFRAYLPQAVHNTPLQISIVSISHQPSIVREGEAEGSYPKAPVTELRQISLTGTKCPIGWDADSVFVSVRQANSSIGITRINKRKDSPREVVLLKLRLQAQEWIRFLNITRTSFII